MKRAMSYRLSPVIATQNGAQPVSGAAFTKSMALIAFFGLGLSHVSR